MTNLPAAFLSLEALEVGTWLVVPKEAAVVVAEVPLVGEVALCCVDRGSTGTATEPQS